MTTPLEHPDFHFLRINPFRGLTVDENTWADAHNYHRNQLRLHLLTLHGIGVVQGLEVVASQPPGMTVTVKPGLAIDPEGRMLLLSEAQTVQLSAPNTPSSVFITLEFSERVAQMQTVTEGSQPQPVRILEECSVQVRQEAATGGVEIARVSLDSTVRLVRAASNPLQPGLAEIDLTGRNEVGSGRAGGGGGKAGRDAITVGVLRYGQTGSVDWKRHTEGLRRLLRDVSTMSNLDGNLLDGVNPLDEAAMRNCQVLYITGTTAFSYSGEEEQALRRFLDRGGLLWCEPCRSGVERGFQDEFSRSCFELARHFNRQPTQLRPGHPLLRGQYLFAAPPPALDPSGVVLEAGRMVIATGDYGCFWDGRGNPQDAPPSRETLRAAQEFGANALHSVVS